MNKIPPLFPVSCFLFSFVLAQPGSPRGSSRLVCCRWARKKMDTDQKQKKKRERKKGERKGERVWNWYGNKACRLIFCFSLLLWSGMEIFLQKFRSSKVKRRTYVVTLPLLLLVNMYSLTFTLQITMLWTAHQSCVAAVVVVCFLWIFGAERLLRPASCNVRWEASMVETTTKE